MYLIIEALIISLITYIILHKTPLPLSYRPEDLTDENSFSMSTDLAGRNLLLKDLGCSYEGNTSSTLFFSRNIHFRGSVDVRIRRIWAGFQTYSKAIDLVGQNMISKDLE